MESFTATIDLDVTPAQAWAVLSDYARDPEWRTGVVAMRPDRSGPATVGTVTDEEIRLGGRTYRNRGEVVAVVPGEHLAWRTIEGADASGSRSVQPIGDGCRVQLDLQVRPRGVDRVLAPLLRPMLAKNLRRDVEALGRLLGASRIEPATSGAAVGP